MRIDVTIGFSTLYDCKKADIALGQTFIIKTDQAADVEWSFGTPDNTLTVETEGNVSKCTASSIGSCNIHFIRGKNVVEVFTVNVVPSILLNGQVKVEDLKNPE